MRAVVRMLVANRLVSSPVSHSRSRQAWRTRLLGGNGCVAHTSAPAVEPVVARDPTPAARQQVDYTTLYASVEELQSWIPSRVEQVVQWHQQCVAMRLRSAEDDTWMYLSWHPIAARVSCGEAPQRGAVSEAYSFGEALHKSLRGLVLTTASLPVAFERVVHLTFSQSLDEDAKHALWCEVMGRYSNVILANGEGEIKLCAHQVGTKLSSLRQLQVGGVYQVPPPQSGISPEGLTTEQEFCEMLDGVSRDPDFKGKSSMAVLVRCFQGISPCLAQDLLTKASVDSEAAFHELTPNERQRLLAEFRGWIRRLQENSFHPSLSSETNKYSLMGMPGVWFRSVHGLLESYYKSVETGSSSSKLSHGLRSAVKKSLTRLEAKRKKLIKSLTDAEKADAMQKKGDLIIANLHNYLPGSSSLSVDDWETGERLEIPLDPLKSAVDSAQSFFKRAKKMRRARESVQPLLEQVEQEMQYIGEVEESVRELEESEDEDDAQALSEIREELIQGGYMKAPPDHHLASKALKKSSKKKATQQGSPADPDGLRLFTSPSGFRILIGRNNKQNDLLSKTKGKPGDLWFHARGVPGAHVLLKLDGKPDQPEDRDIQCAAELAAYYSKARNGGKVPVSMTKAENVSKPRGVPPGMVQITKESTIQVRPAESLAYKKDNT